MLVNITIVFADEEGIVITNDDNASPVTIETDQSTIDIPILVKGINDVYAFSLSIEFSPNDVQVESISAGAIFSDYGSAIIQNNIDNDAGQVSFMQTMLSVDKGVDGGGVLCVARMTFEDGTYEFGNDIQLQVQIANSVPEYIDVHVLPCTVSVDTKVAGSESQPTLSPIPIATIGVVSPDPESEQANTFEIAEDQTVEEILEEVEGYTESKESGSETISDLADKAFESGEQLSSQPILQPSGKPEVETVTKQIDKTVDNTLWFIIGAVATVIILGGFTWILLRKRKKELSTKK